MVLSLFVLFIFLVRRFSSSCGFSIRKVSLEGLLEVVVTRGMEVRLLGR